MKLPANRPLLWVGVAIEASLLGMLALGDLREGFSLFLLLFFLAFGAYLGALALLRAGAAPGPWAVILLAAAFRITLLPTPPTLSDDVHRFVWDGRVQAAGVNPYRYAPASRRLDRIRTTADSEINHPEVRTIYPPAAQMVFFMLGVPGSGLYLYKAAFIVMDLLLVAVLISLLRRRSRAVGWAIVYAWNPLVIVEVAGSGHYEPLPLLFLFLAYLMAPKSRFREGAAFAVAVLSKWFPLPLLLAHHRTGGRRWLAAFLLVSVLLFLPYLGAGQMLFSGLETYAHSWRWNDSLFRVLSAFDGLHDGAPFVGKVMACAILLGVIGVCRIRAAEPLRTGYLYIGALLLLGPVLHPWYVLWIVPFLCFFPNAAWLALSALVVLSYHAAFAAAGPGAPWTEAPGFWRMEYLPFYVLLVGGWAARLRRCEPEVG